MKKMTIIKKHLKNHFWDRGEIKPFLIVIHIAQGTREQVISTFKYEEKSSNYLVCRNGEIIEFVPPEKAAWANGIPDKPSSELVSKYLSANPKVNPNLFTISIEHEGWSLINDIQYQKSAELIRELCKKFNIEIDRKHIIGHREISSYKRCPDLIDMERLVALAFSKPETIKATASTSTQLAEIQQKITWLQALINKLRG